MPTPPITLRRVLEYSEFFDAENPIDVRAALRLFSRGMLGVAFAKTNPVLAAAPGRLFTQWGVTFWKQYCATIIWLANGTDEYHKLIRNELDFYARLGGGKLLIDECKAVKMNGECRDDGDYSRLLEGLHEKIEITLQT